MNFEQALRSELILVTNLSNKVFPLNVPEGVSAPFLIYSKANTDYVKSMDGTSTTRVGRYDLDIVTPTYTGLQDLIIAIKNKILTFEGRVIGTLGPFVQSVIIDNIVELFEEKVMFYRANMEIRFYYEGS